MTNKEKARPPENMIAYTDDWTSNYGMIHWDIKGYIFLLYWDAKKEIVFYALNWNDLKY